MIYILKGGNKLSEDKNIKIHDGIGIGEQKQLMNLTETLMEALTEEEFIQIVEVYNKAIGRLIDQDKKRKDRNMNKVILIGSGDIG